MADSGDADEREDRGVPLVLGRRSLPDQLRYLARKLAEGEDPVKVRFALEVMANELEPPGP